MDWDNNCYFLLTSEAIASVLEIPREASPSAFLYSSVFWERFVTPPSASAPAYVYYIRLDSFSLIHVNISPPGANLSQMVLKHFRTIHCISWKGRILMCLLTENVRRGLGKHRGMWALENTDLGVVHTGPLLTVPVWPWTSSLTSTSLFSHLYSGYNRRQGMGWVWQVMRFVCGL